MGIVPLILVGLTTRMPAVRGLAPDKTTATIFIGIVGAFTVGLPGGSRATGFNLDIYRPGLRQAG